MLTLHRHHRATALAAGIGAALLVTIAASPATATGATPVEGVWQRHEQSFTFVGFTSNYSCEGLADKLRLLLREAGARADVRAVGGGCVGPRGMEGPSKISSAQLVWYTLTPASAAAPAAATPAPPAAAPAREVGRAAPKLQPKADLQTGIGAWKTVKWAAHSPRELDEGDCELVEQFARELLPKFTTRNVASHMSCVPHQISPGAINVAFESLAALPEAEKPATRSR